MSFRHVENGKLSQGLPPLDNGSDGRLGMEGNHGIAHSTETCKALDAHACSLLQRKDAFHGNSHLRSRGKQVGDPTCTDETTGMNSSSFILATNESFVALRDAKLGYKKLRSAVAFEFVQMGSIIDPGWACMP